MMPRLLPASLFHPRRLACFCLAAGLWSGALPARADVRLPGIFGDHMVLQQEATLPVWGWANPQEKVVVTFGNEKAETTAGPDGKWRIDLPALPAGTPAGTLTVAGTNTITINDVLVGEVWLCSGQSNMELPLTKTDDAAGAAAQANDGQLRLCMVPSNLALAPRDDLSPTTPAADIWEVCTPATVGKFSAVGYYFGKNLRAALKRPVGLIEDAWGGTAAQVWTDPATLQSDPVLHHYVEEQEKFAAKYPGGDTDFAAQMAAQTQPGQKPGASLVKRGYGPTIPSSLFDAMIHPIIPFAIKGVIWYQGEDNAEPASALEYAKLFPAMITGWRKLWKEGDFPFLYVQLANLAQRYRDNWPLVREAQFKTLSLPKTGMAVTLDIGTPYFIHPPDKADVGLRLSLLARHIAYGENVVCSGPLYASMKVEGANDPAQLSAGHHRRRIDHRQLAVERPEGEDGPVHHGVAGLHDRGRRPEVGRRTGNHRRGHRGGFERAGAEPDGRSLRVGAESAGQPLQQERPSRLAFPHRRLEPQEFDRSGEVGISDRGLALRFYSGSIPRYCLFFPV